MVDSLRFHSFQSLFPVRVSEPGCFAKTRTNGSKSNNCPLTGLSSGKRIEFNSHTPRYGGTYSRLYGATTRCVEWRYRPNRLSGRITSCAKQRNFTCQSFSSRRFSFGPPRAPLRRNLYLSIAKSGTFCRITASNATGPIRGRESGGPASTCERRQPRPGIQAQVLGPLFRGGRMRAKWSAGYRLPIRRTACRP